MWQSATIAHANGATGIAGLVAVSNDPAAMAAPYASLYGVPAERAADGSLSVAAGKARLRFASPALAATLFPGIVFKAKPPFVPALELFVADPAKTKAFLAGAGVPYRSAPDGALEVPPTEASGVLLRFVRKR
jgi:hypothetical protein